jgi:ubiquinone/menaquinone biosynthesis C-methylase UbiE
MMHAEGDVSAEPLGLAGMRWENKSQRVREVFENAPHYLKGRQVDIRFRAETVKEFAEHVSWQRLLDIGCGDGTISLQLLKDKSHLTLMDLSSNMTAIVKQNIPPTLTTNVEVRNEDFLKATFAAKPFDLIVSVGVMAHVNSPDEFLAKIRTLLPLGGSAIIEFTDCRHFTGRIERLTSNLKEIFRPGKFRTNRLSFSQVAHLFEKNNLKLVSTFRYAMIPIPGIQKVISPKLLYKIISMIFGRCRKNRNAYLGNEYICLLTAI